MAVPSAPTNVAATAALTDKVRVTWTPGTGETSGHTVYRDGADISGVLAHVDNMTITDGGFESWVNANTPSYWAIAGAGGSITRETTTKKTGTYSVKIVRNGANKEVGRTITADGGQAIAWWVGKVVTIGAWVYCTTASGCRLTIWDGASAAYHAMHGGSGWEYLVSTITVGAGANNINLYCTVVVDCTAYYDTLTGVMGAAVHDGVNGLCIPFDDTTAAAPVITPGAAEASDGTNLDKVALSLSGNSIANGTEYDYTVKAINADGLSSASSIDHGNRAAGTLTYQWQRSAADSDANYADINGATTAAYDDTGAPANGAGRYFRCLLDATNSDQAISSVNRGYRNVAAATMFIQGIMGVHYVPSLGGF